jgi:hypothetical protein
LEQEKFKNELEAKNRKLTTKALQLSTKIELIDDLIRTLSRESDDLQNVDINNIIKQFKILQKQTHEEESFLVHFEEVNQGFLSKLKQLHPDLNSNDIRFLSYVFMNLSIKEISTIFNITPEVAVREKSASSRKWDTMKT